MKARSCVKGKKEGGKMKALDNTVYEIVEKAMEGNGLTPDETKVLFEQPETSRETAFIRWAGQELSVRCCDNIAEIHAQIGLNSTVCPKNCKFCSFAAINGVRKGVYELPVEDVLEYAKIYEEDGANLILLLTTASYSFDKLIEMIKAVRGVISPNMPLLVNTEDMTLERAEAIKAAGAQGAYHAIRMREGEDTGIPVEDRLKTFGYMKEAGLKLSTCVEPVGPENTPEELMEATFRCINSNAKTSGVGKRINVPGTLLCERGMITDVANANMVAIYRLATGSELKLNCSANTVMTAASGANLAWAEVGTNPRDLVKRTEDGGRGASIAQQKKMFAASGWELREGPSPGWFD